LYSSGETPAAKAGTAANAANDNTSFLNDIWPSLVLPGPRPKAARSNLNRGSLIRAAHLSKVPALCQFTYLR
jgi:hypothetical protein